MRQQCDESYVLDTQELGEADLIVTLLAEQHGKVRAVARSARRSRRRFGGVLEPMTRVRATWFEREGRDLHRLEALECRRSFASMQSDPVCQAACAVLAEIGRSLTHEGQADAAGFRLLGAVLDALERGADSWVSIRYFEYWMLRLHGLLPDLQLCSDCSSSLSGGGRIGADGSALLCEECAGRRGQKSRVLTAEERAFLEKLRRHPPLQLPASVPRRLRNGALEPLLRGTLEAYAERKFRSYRHLRAAEDFGADRGRP